MCMCRRPECDCKVMSARHEKPNLWRAALYPTTLCSRGPVPKLAVQPPHFVM